VKRLFAIALDYDGTIALNDTVDASIRDAIAALRTRGVTVVLATGRILDDLRRVAGELHFVDAVIAENGAVLHFPESGHTTSLAPPVPTAFIDELSRRGTTLRGLAEAGVLPPVDAVRSRYDLLEEPLAVAAG
jgi:hydroxymethylpyrimidine pyrophosphatase-like HAD family hydrolase